MNGSSEKNPSPSATPSSTSSSSQTSSRRPKIKFTSFILVFSSCFLLPALALFLTSKPHVLLKVPRIGFILYALAGGPLPPYFNQDVFQDDVGKVWMRKGDVFLSSCGKCGSTWLMNIVHEIRTKGTPKPFKDIYLEIPLPEFVFYPGQPLMERAEWLKNVSLRYPFAAYKTHYHPPALKLRDDAKYIVSVRNFVDAVASLKPFIRDHGIEFAKMWGGFPPQAGKPASSDEDVAYERYVMEDMGNGKSELGVFLTDFLLAWWPLRNEKNVHFTHYANRFRDSRGELQRLATFLEVKLSSEELDLVEKHTSFEEMKRNSQHFNLNVFDDFKAAGKVPKDVQFISGHTVLFGPLRDGRNDLTSSLVDRIEKETERLFGPQIADWIRNGGPVPDVEVPPPALPES